MRLCGPSGQSNPSGREMNLFDSLSPHCIGIDGANTCSHATSSCHIQLGSDCWARLPSAQCGRAADLAAALARQQKPGPLLFVCLHNLGELLRNSQRHKHINRHTHARRVERQRGGWAKGARWATGRTRAIFSASIGVGWEWEEELDVEAKTRSPCGVTRTVKDCSASGHNFSADWCAQTANCDPGSEQKRPEKLP